jgi:hypothetical protein
MEGGGILMPKPFSEWTVLPHGRLTRLDENILTVTGLLKMPVGEVERRMTAVRLRDGGLVAFSVIALDEPEMRSLEAFGTPTFMVVPNEIHRLDARVWKERYPEITVVAPARPRGLAAQNGRHDGQRAAPAVRGQAASGQGRTGSARAVRALGGPAGSASHRRFTRQHHHE